VAELMRQQIAAGARLLPFTEITGRATILARALVLQADVPEMVTEREQKLVMVVVGSPQQRIRLLHELAMHGQLTLPDFEHLRAVGKQVEMHGRLATGIEVQALEIASRIQR